MAGVVVHHAPEKAPNRNFWLGVWATVAGGFTALDLWRYSRQDRTTFSDSIRYLFDINTRKGKRRFLFFFIPLSAWFARHILH